LVDQHGTVPPVSTIALERAAAESVAPAEPERPAPPVLSGSEAAASAPPPVAAAPAAVAATPPAEAPAPATVPVAESPPPRVFGPPAPPPRAGRMEARALRPARARRPDKADVAARALESLKSAEARFQWGDLDGAESLARIAVRELAQSPRAFYLLGVVLLAKGEAAQAKTAFERTLAIDPAFPDADAKLRLANDRAALSHP
jgi:hypothetical protein